MKLLVDSDAWRYRYGFAAQKTVDPILPTDDTVLIVEPFHNVVRSIQQGLKKHMDLAGCDSYELYLSGHTNFRYEIDPIREVSPDKYEGYKANRMKMPRPYHYNNITDYMVDVLDAIVVEGMEADDRLVIEQTADTENTVICTQDKDMDQCVGWKYNFVKEQLYYITPEEAEYNLWMQVLTGDVVDNIKGLPGIGPVKAAKILAEPRVPGQELSGLVAQAYEKYYGKETYYQELDKTIKLVRLLTKNSEEDVPW